MKQQTSAEMCKFSSKAEFWKALKYAAASVPRTQMTQSNNNKRLFEVIRREVSYIGNKIANCVDKDVFLVLYIKYMFLLLVVYSK